MKKEVIMVYTDGACSNNPGGPGGWAATIHYADRYDIISGYHLCTTNNRMELMAVVKAIEKLLNKGYSKIIVNSDSAYVVNGINKEWIHGWAKNGWKSKSNSTLANADLWKQLYEYITKDGVTIFFNKVAGHSGHMFNEMADSEARKEVEHAKRILQQQDCQF